VGFCLFPVGWSWTEYKLVRNEVPREYEQRAKQVGLLGIENDYKQQTDAGRQASELGKSSAKIALSAS
jgi:hypothetical protein